jgi:hypothetical protein
MDSSGSVDLDESRPPFESPIPSQSRGRSLFFNGEEEPSPELHLVETEEGAGDGSASVLEPTSDGYADLSDDDPTSWDTSPAAGDRPAQLLSKAQLRATFRAGVKTVSGVTHTVAAKTPEAQQVGLYLADDDDAKAIGDPLADIAYRREDIGIGKLSPDANDLIRSMMGVGNYFAKQVALLGEVRRLQAGQAAGEIQPLPREVA